MTPKSCLIFLSGSCEGGEMGTWGGKVEVGVSGGEGRVTD